MFWDLDKSTIEFMVSCGSERVNFYCPEFAKMNCDYLWDFNTNYSITGYFWMMDSATGRIDPTTNARIKLKGDDGKMLVKKSSCSRPSDTELATDIVISNIWIRNATFPNGDFARVDGSWYKDKGEYYRTNHLPNGISNRAEGSNVGFVDGHISWRKFDDMKARYLFGGGAEHWW